ncbi:MAG TPA: peptidoglycan-binding domain-containing protein [Candidatus Competibacteraceae bacterium]|nr:peptidoglycan-binding domain-containing protein [Candidatus Competibacteraceae bacterium]
MKRLFTFEAEPFEFGSVLEEIAKSSPDYVRWMQRSLNQILGLRLAADGILGSQTRSAIRSFQQRRGLRADGVVGVQTERALIAAGASPPPDSRATPPPGSVPSAVPTLIKPKETTPPAYTLYVDIPLNAPLGKARSMTGIFIPKDYCPLPQVDLIVYLHGYKLRSHKPHYSIDAYWCLPRFLLREEVNNSKKNVILVAPTLGPKNEPGNLVHPGGFDKFLDQVMTALKQYGPHVRAQRVPSVGNLILACHSGSGWVMRKIAMGSARYAAKIQECWAYDPYNMGDANGWADWARSHPQAKLYIYFLPYSPGQQLCKNLIGKSMPNLSPVKCMPNVLAVKSTVGHDDVPARHLKERIQGVQLLIDKWNCPSDQIRERR